MATLTIPDPLYTQLQAIAARRQRPVEDWLLEAIEKLAADVDEPAGAPLTREEVLRKLREADPELIWSEDDVESLFDGLDLPPMSDEEAERIVAAIPPLDPPLSQTIIDMREEERY
ncbi:MAG TPA: hypothetical protein VFV93_16745 [Thermomicrobiales bacterium]|nr:hypothetical protein [Thermomicrobiales bacterium]